MLSGQSPDKACQAVKTILIVDDDPLIVHLLSRILERRGYGVVTADSAQQAHEVMQSRPVELVITDIQMPETDGLAFTRHVKSLTPHLPVLLMTGDRTRYGDGDAREAGADGFITKPFTAPVLLALIASLLK